jgi:hypothetical protein
MNRTSIVLIMIVTMTTAIILLPFFTFAIPQNGDQATTDYIKVLVGSDGDHYFRNGVQTSIKYYPDGSTGSFFHENYDGPRQHYLIKPDGEANYYGYCIEQGVSFPDAQHYTGVGWINDSYFSALPTTVQTGIMLATIFGWQPGKHVPVSGCNDDDWYWATQVIIWEYQQKLRLSPTILQGNGFVSANYFQSTLDGRPAEKCYNYILESMSEYQKIPSFTASTPANAPLNVLKWDSSKLLWTLTLNDTNQTSHPLVSEDEALRINNTGNQYTFSSKTEFDVKSIKFKKNVPLPSHELLIWGGANRTQAIATGAADPIQFFALFRTEQPGTFDILKNSEDGEKEGFIFELKDQNGQTTILTTNQEGLASSELTPGEYVISEIETNQYRMPQIQTIEIKENETTKLEIVNILKKGRIQIHKRVIDSISNSTSSENGAVFQIFSANFTDFANSPENLRDEITTDIDGIATTKELPLGNYIMRQIVASKNITISKDVSVTIENDMQTVQLAIDNHFQKGKIQVIKTNKLDQPLAGAKFILRNSEDLLQADGTLKYIKGTILDLLTSDNNGLASSDWLFPGVYEIEEIKAPTGYVIPKNSVTTVTLSPDNQVTTTFFNQVSIQNNTVDVYPNTGDEARITTSRIILILMVMSLIGIGVLAYIMREQNKTLH